MLEGPFFTTSTAVLVLVVLASLVGIITYRWNFPYTVALLLVGVALGHSSLEQMLPFSPQLILVVFLPGLLFEAALHLRSDHLRRLWGLVVLLAGPGVLITMGIVAGIGHWLFDLPVASAVMLGAMVAPTDPIAVVGIFRRLGVPPLLSTVIEGESLLNDGAGLVAYSLALAVALGTAPDVAHVTALFLWTAGGGLILGAGTGFVASRFVVHVDDHLIEVTISVALAYGTYLMAAPLRVSGVLAVIAAGLVFGTYGRAIGLSQRTQEALDAVWEYVAFLLNSVVFLLLGSALRLSDLVAMLPLVLGGVLASVIGRAVAVYGLSLLPVLVRRRPLPLGWRHMIFWSGLRGALSLALA
ncbi:MAG: sodium:proton antiporter [Chloroflexi bacterium]|nr:sodium:proton antiporter [Chloroflexota bacterium]